ncbi:MAG: MMPL family transporter [Myxococcota bacterium]
MSNQGTGHTDGAVARRGSGPGLVALVLLGLLVAAGVFVALRLEVTTDISEFLPTGADRERARISAAVAKGEASRTIMPTLDAGAPDRAAAVSRAFEQQLRADSALMEQLAFVEAGPPEGIDQALWELYHPRRLSFAAPDEASARARVSDAGLEEAASEIRRRLASPLSTLVTKTAPEDPFLSIPRLFDRLQQGRTDALATVDGRFVAEERYAVILLGTQASAFDAPAQRRVQAGLDAALERLRAEVEVGPVESSSLARFSIRAEQTIKSDIQRTTLLSLLGLCLLCLVVLRSFRLVVLTLVPIGCAMLAATAVSLALYGRVHGLTFAFGASLIGVCVDYVVHFYVHHTLHPSPQGAHGTLRRIWPALLLGATTTAIGFAIMGGSSFPGLRQVAIFATVGVTVALLSTRVLLPPLLPRVEPRAVLRDRLADALAAAFGRLRRRRSAGIALVLAAVAATAWGATAVPWQDNLGSIGRMDRLDPAMLEEDERVRARVARFDQGRFIVALGDNEEHALLINDQVGDALHQATDAGELRAWQGVCTLLPSATRQQAIDLAIRAAPDLRPRLEKALAAAGFHEQLFAPFFEHVRQLPPAPLTFDDLRRSPAAPLVRSMRIEVGEHVGFLTVIREIEDPEALAARIDAIQGAQYIDQTALMTSAMRAYRVRTVQLLGLGLLAVLLILGWRYRSPRVTLAVVAPAVLAGGVTIAVLAATGRRLDLIGLTAILMILSIGVDYGVFLAETRDDLDAALPATLLGLLVCWLSTVLGFGVLALSEHPTMNTIGVVAAVGVTASLLLAPTTLALLPATRAASRATPRESS